MGLEAKLLKNRFERWVSKQKIKEKLRDETFQNWKALGFEENWRI